MEGPMESGECQLHSLQPIQVPVSGFEQLRHRLKHAVRRRLKYLANVIRRLVRPKQMPSTAIGQPAALQPGDRVRVRSRDEIRATLSDWNRLNGCGFMEEMWEFCGTEQTVMKKMGRFLDEQDYTLKRVRGNMYLLEGVICNGTVDWGPCDRSCFFFWREEWLEKL